MLFHTEKRKNEGGFNKEDSSNKDETIIFPMEKNKHTDVYDEKAAFPKGKAATSTKNLGGAGLNKEDVMLNVDTFKNLYRLTQVIFKCFN